MQLIFVNKESSPKSNYVMKATPKFFNHSIALKEKMKYFSILIISLFVLGCQPSDKPKEETADKSSDLKEGKLEMSQYPELLQKALAAHGGLNTWKKYGSLKYNKVNAEGDSESQLINLNNRRVFIDRDSVQIGFNGSEVWVSPDLASYGKGSARFYHNLHFYFFGIPFLLADPGINYEDVGTKTINNKSYRALKITYNEGVGDSDSDVYIALFNPESFKLELLLYTVTYYSGEKTDSYNALMYPEWQRVDGLLVPKQYVGYQFKNDSLGDKRYSASFESILFAKTEPLDDLFQMPTNAEVDSLSNY